MIPYYRTPLDQKFPLSYLLIFTNSKASMEKTPPITLCIFTCGVLPIVMEDYIHLHLFHRTLIGPSAKWYVHEMLVVEPNYLPDS